MITGVSVIQSSVETSISDGTVSRLLFTEGTGMNPRHDITQVAPQEHGETFIDYRLDKRHIDLLLLLQGTQAQMTTKRRQLMGLFHPDFLTVLRFSTTDGLRDIAVRFTDSFTVPSADRMPLSQRVRISFNAYKPFYDPSGVYLPFALGGGGGAFVVPMTVPFFLGTGTLNMSLSTDNNAPDFWRARPIITITGPITDAKITNVTTGKVIDFTGNSIGSGVVYVIDTRTDAPTVTEGTTNRIDKITAASDLAGFYISRGTTTFLVTGTGITAVSLVEIRFNAQLLGI